MGRRDRQRAREEIFVPPKAPTICPLCERDLGDSHNDHHLIPKTFGGKETVRIHRICHDKIHSVFSERELLHHYHTIPRLLENEHIQAFVKWVKNKDPDFYDGNKDHKDRRRKRR